MDSINQNTKISSLLNQHPESLNALVKLSPKFNKLRNPLLRKIMAPRTSIAMACKMGNCSIDEFFNSMEDLGFTIEKNIPLVEEENIETPDFIKNITQYDVIELDVRPMIEKSQDPFQVIMKTIQDIQPKNVLKLINIFEPLPLIKILTQKGFESYVEHINDNLVHTYFHPKEKQDFKLNTPQGESWDKIFSQYEHHLQTIDVREFEMPLPMVMILEALENLPENKALFVYHKRIPVYLLPELEEKGFKYSMKEIDCTNVHLLIYKA